MMMKVLNVVMIVHDEELHEYDLQILMKNLMKYFLLIELKDEI